MKWTERLHPRDDRGQFSRKAGSRWLARVMKGIKGDRPDLFEQAQPGRREGRLNGEALDLGAVLREHAVFHGSGGHGAHTHRATGGSGTDLGDHTSRVSAGATSKNPKLLAGRLEDLADEIAANLDAGEPGPGEDESTVDRLRNTAADLREGLIKPQIGMEVLHGLTVRHQKGDTADAIRRVRGELLADKSLDTSRVKVSNGGTTTTPGGTVNLKPQHAEALQWYQEMSELERRGSAGYPSVSAPHTSTERYLMRNGLVGETGRITDAGREALAGYRASFPGGTATVATKLPGKKVSIRGVPEGMEIRDTGATDYAGEKQYAIFDATGNEVGRLQKVSWQSPRRVPGQMYASGYTKHTEWRAMPTNTTVKIDWGTGSTAAEALEQMPSAEDREARRAARRAGIQADLERAQMRAGRTSSGEQVTVPGLGDLTGGELARLGVKTPAETLTPGAVRISRRQSFTGQAVEIELKDGTIVKGNLAGWGTSFVSLRPVGGGGKQDYSVVRVAGVYKPKQAGLW